ncbi:hypothetical protein NX059_006608 [Plenodomus lindquistii]|nr:hypothetical protein NX059_006608 [Plenodomus lindquistii]
MNAKSWLLAAIASAAPILSLTTLDRQCWHEHPLSRITLQSSTHGHYDLVQPVQINPKDQTPHHPWSYPPICTPHLSSFNSPLCIYTSTTFAHDRGISLFTTPSLAAHFLSLPVFSTPSPSILTSDAINAPTNTYRTAAIPGRGIGMLASRDLDFGDRITAYTPAFVAALEGELGTMEREGYWRAAIEGLPAGMREMFMGLATVYGDERVRVQDVVKANTFQLDVAGVNHLAVWPETSRFNHDCAPNAQYILNPDTLTHHVHATRPIAAGEEITISYTTPFDNTSVRQSHLASFGFTCTCRRCTSPSTDDTLSLITTLEAQLNNWSATSVASIEMVEQLLKLHVDEGLEGFMDIAYGFAALTYSSFGNEVEAESFARKAKGAIEMKDGVWSANWKVWQEMLDQEKGGVKGHWSWRRRVGQ